MINSVLDTDLYKFTQMQIVASQYPDAQARYEWIDRQGTIFPANFVKHLRQNIEKLADLKLTEQEEEFLLKFPWIKAPFVDMLKGYRFSPRQVKIEEKGTSFSLSITGPWYQTILFEVPLMAMISQLYFEQEKYQLPNGWENSIKQKAKELRDLEVAYADFGTRRRYSDYAHEEVVVTHKDISKGKFIGTSNVHLARLYDLTPIGTQAHEWFSAHGAMFGYRMANSMALDHWADFYGGRLGIALTDTFTSAAFWEAFTPKFARLFDGVRHDSGSPLTFAANAIEHYKKLGIDPLTKTIVFSDSLNPGIVRIIENQFRGKVKTAYGIGTNLTNDFGHQPLNMVIKLVALAKDPDSRWVSAFKLSDVKGKETGDQREIEACKFLLGIVP